MKGTISLLVLMVVLGCASGLTMGQDCAPLGNIIGTNLGGLMNFEIQADILGAEGDNLIGIPVLSSTDTFKEICAIYGLTTANSTVLQINPLNGTVTSYTCNQTVDPAFCPGQGAIIFTTEIPPPGSRSGIIAGVEAALDPYCVYADGPGAAGDNLFPVPWTMASNSPVDVCNWLNLRPTISGACNGSNCTAGLLGNACTNVGPDPACNVNTADEITQIVPIHNFPLPGDAPKINSHICGSVVPGFEIRLGEALLIRPTKDGICDILGTGLCTRGKVGTTCAAHTDCDAPFAQGTMVGGTVACGTVMML